MPVHTPDRTRRERAAQESAQALAAAGKLTKAMKQLDVFLAQHDGDWGLWLYFAGLCARCGRMGQAVAAYRASARQLEADGFYARARAALVCAARLKPTDKALMQEAIRLGELARGPVKARPKPPPEPEEVLTDPFCPLFDFLDEEKRATLAG